MTTSDIVAAKSDVSVMLHIGNSTCALTLAQTTTPPKPCHLFKLPPELRLEIYSFLLADFRISKSEPWLSEPPLLQVSQAIRDESVDVFNKRLSAILEERSVKLKVAENATTQCRERYHLEHTDSSFGRWEKSIRTLGRLNKAFVCAEEAIESEREQLKKEGFQV